MLRKLKRGGEKLQDGTEGLWEQVNIQLKVPKHPEGRGAMPLLSHNPPPTPPPSTLAPRATHVCRQWVFCSSPILAS